MKLGKTLMEFFITGAVFLLVVLVITGNFPPDTDSPSDHGSPPAESSETVKPVPQGSISTAPVNEALGNCRNAGYGSKRCVESLEELSNEIHFQEQTELAEESGALPQSHP